ncbi:hypothetical protein E3N88_01795 [Mikania micrantha]|uniref:Uncharacterized protein n=1 Tax=Mikania micrantha TaxID=192012 RepID=A0A5N6Q242_9ASTR|nr:hypothetical protein E3N88_01795 [Mikania micrantha]
MTLKRLIVVFSNAIQLLRRVAVAMSFLFVTRISQQNVLKAAKVCFVDSVKFVDQKWCLLHMILLSRSCKVDFGKKADELSQTKLNLEDVECAAPTRRKTVKATQFHILWGALIIDILPWGYYLKANTSPLLNRVESSKLSNFSGAIVLRFVGFWESMDFNNCSHAMTSLSFLIFDENFSLIGQQKCTLERLVDQRMMSVHMALLSRYHGSDLDTVQGNALDNMEMHGSDLNVVHSKASIEYGNGTNMEVQPRGDKGTNDVLVEEIHESCNAHKFVVNQYFCLDFGWHGIVLTQFKVSLLDNMECRPMKINENTHVEYVQYYARCWRCRKVAHIAWLKLTDKHFYTLVRLGKLSFQPLCLTRNKPP